jgi:formylglycine-generating enzyme required for sulfatase activity
VSGTEDCCASNVVPGGTFSRSYDGVSSGYTDASYTATVSELRLDVYEVTVGRFRAFVEAGKGTQGSPPAAGAGAHPLIGGSGWQSGWDGELEASAAALMSAVKCSATYETWTDGAGGNERRPMNCLSWYDAFAFCAWDGGRLATEAEWNYAAAGGSEQRVYPWSVPASATSIDCTRASYGCGSNTCGDGAAGCGLGDLIGVGTKPGGNGRWGQSDLGGNVWEWVLDWYEAPYPSTQCNNCANLSIASYRVLRGGDFGNDASDLLASRRGYYDPSYRYGVVGARCARTP